VTPHPPLGRRIAKAAVIVGGGVLVSRGLGLVRDMVFASTLGANAFTDEYQVAFIIPDFLNYLLAGGYMAITFIPILSRHMAERDTEGGWRAFSTIATAVGAAMVVLVVIGMVAARQIIDIIEPGFDAAQVERATALTRIVLPAQFFFVVGSLLMAVQYANERFAIPTLAPIVYNLGIIAGGVLLRFDGAASPEGFAWGVLGGAIVGNFLIQLYGARRAGLRYVAPGPLAGPTVREYLSLAIPLMVGQSLVVLDEQLGRSFGSLAEPGSISWLQFARRTMLVPVGVIAQAAGVAAYPFLARLAAENRLRQLATTLRRALQHVVALSIGAAALVMALALPLIRLLYERGDWTAADTAATVGPLVLFALGIPLWGAQQLYARGFYARRQMWPPAIVGTVATLLALPLYWALQEAFAVSGLALASTIALAAYTGVLALMWHRSTGTELLRPLAQTVRRVLPMAAAGGIAAWSVSEIVLDGVGGGAGGAIAALLAGTVAFGAVLFVAVHAVVGDA
jgi:putative peptidoglycan lipid II flippase